LHRVNARIALEQAKIAAAAATAAPSLQTLALAEWKAAMKKERETFFDRLPIHGKTFMRDYSGNTWYYSTQGWDLLHAAIKDAKDAVAGTTDRGNINMRFAKRFLADIEDRENRHNFVFDTVAVDNIWRWFAAFEPEHTIYNWEWLDFIQLLGWKKKATGEYRFAQCWWTGVGNAHENVLVQGMRALAQL
jgi:hypothetical protein